MSKATYSSWNFVKEWAEGVLQLSIFRRERRFFRAIVGTRLVLDSRYIRDF